MKQPDPDSYQSEVWLDGELWYGQVVGWYRSTHQCKVMYTTPRGYDEAGIARAACNRWGDQQGFIVTAATDEE